MPLFQKYNTLDDRQLVKRYQEKLDQEALGVLFRRYVHLVSGLCLSYLKHPEDTQDAVMEIFEKLATSIPSYQIENFENWLYIVSKNHCLKRLREKLRHRTETWEESDPEIFMEFSEENDPIYEEKLERLSDAIDALREEQRQCIVLFYFQDLSYKYIAQHTGYSLNEVKSYIQNGRRQLHLFYTQHVTAK